VRGHQEIVTAARLAGGGIAVAAAMLVLAACESKAPTAANAAPTMGEARFRPINGSSVVGAAIVSAYDGGVRLQVNFNGEAPGQYRVMIHANGNCSSPNGFSAGAPWAPPGVPLKEEGYPIHKNDDSASFVVRLAGYRIDGPDGVLGRSVVLHAGAIGSLAAVPGVPNNRIGCGVVGPPSKGLLDMMFKD
jgi:superoxide dismutase, Cu-Zn family